MLFPYRHSGIIKKSPRESMVPYFRWLPKEKADLEEAE
jgi:hypothetical protein